MVKKREKRVLSDKQQKDVKAIVNNTLRENVELKYYDGSPTYQYPISVTAVIFPLSVPAQGDGDTQRDGDRIKLKKIHIRGNLVYSSDVTNIVRVIWFQWKPNTTPTAAGLLLNGPSGFIDVHSEYSHDFRQQFNILKDKTYKLIGNGLAATSPLTSDSVQLFKFTISKGFNTQLQYAAGGVTGTNLIYYLAISDSSVISHPALTFNAKVMYTDS